MDIDDGHLVVQRNAQHPCFALDGDCHAKRILRDRGLEAILKQIDDVAEGRGQDICSEVVEESDDGGYVTVTESGIIR